MAATVTNFNSSYKPTGSGLGLLPMNEAIDKVVGSTATLLTRPDGATILVMKAEEGNWELKPGDHAASFPTDPVATTTGATAGTANWILELGEHMVIAAPDKLTVEASDSGDILRYYWV